MDDLHYQTDSSDDVFEPNTLDDEDEWKDVEPETFGPSFLSFGGKSKFRKMEDFLEDARDVYGVDLVHIKNTHGLDTFGMIKLINFVRTQMKNGQFRPDVSLENFLEGDKYLTPVFEDDALLYSIDDIFDIAEKYVPLSTDGNVATFYSTLQVQDMIRENNQLHDQVAYYRSALQKTYLEKMDLLERPGSSEPNMNGEESGSRAKESDSDSHYFSSYAHNDAYRDFIYDNKHLFAGKVVLDVGCGTGILSLFCAKAGAAKVIAVDNSAIIDKAREIVFENGLGETIQCLRGKIEEVTLPVQKVDIIISEWMGYCLLYEAMLDSVIWARNRYLEPDGLMVPSHATLQLSLFADGDYISDKVTFWNSVYGFKMSCMRAKAYDDIVIRTVKPDAVPSRSATFLKLPLHTVQKDDLTVTGANFVLPAEEDIDQLHGFVIHFDIFFTTTRDADIQDAPTSFTTGPLGPETHWQQALALIDTSKLESAMLKTNDQIQGRIALRKGNEYFRELEIIVEWQLENAHSDEQKPDSKHRQKWLMR
ncbi:MAG: hypothetical protein LQ346_000015 [Caloplaca aetnensis]|nr:MAG: hypothetical protein LQ346_000015 [Caloplaca aetnensis]